jgi:hypothetical protein
MPSIRVIAGAAIGFLFVCGLFGCQGVAQTASTEPVGKPMQLPQPMHPGKSETKPRERSAAKHSSKAHLAAKKRASTKLASKESTSNGAAHVTAVAARPAATPSETAWPLAARASVAESAAAVSILQPGPAMAPPSELVINGEAVRVASPDDANEIDLAANSQGALVSDASPAAATVVKAASTETVAPADKSNSGAAAVSQTPSSRIGSMSWLLRVIAALSGAVATGSVAWFLIGPGASADVWVSVSE